MVLPPGGSETASNWTGPKPFAYLRYAPLTTQETLDALGLNDISVAALQQMDDVSLIPDLYRLGKGYAQHYLPLNHFAGFVPEAPR